MTKIKKKNDKIQTSNTIVGNEFRVRLIIENSIDLKREHNIIFNTTHVTVNFGTPHFTT